MLWIIDEEIRMRKDSKWPKGSNQWYLLEPWPRLFSVPNAYSRGRSGEGRSHITRSAQFNRGGMTAERSMSNKCSERISFTACRMQWNWCSIKWSKVLCWQLKPGAERQLKRGVIGYFWYRRDLSISAHIPRYIYIPDDALYYLAVQLN